MISIDCISARPLPLDAALFNCFDPIDEDDTDPQLLDDEPKKKPETVFDGTGFGSDTFDEPEVVKKKKTTAKKKAKAIIAAPLDDKISDEQRVDFYTRAYEPSQFDRTPRPQWTPPLAANDNQKGKHSFPALRYAMVPQSASLGPCKSISTNNLTLIRQCFPEGLA